MLCASLLLATSCAKPHYYTPSTQRVDNMGVEAAARRLAERLIKAEGPLASDVQYSAEAVSFVCLDRLVAIPGRFESGAGAVTRMTCPSPSERANLHFLDITRIEIVQPEYIVTLLNADKRLLFRVKLMSREAAFELVDLLAWFRDSAARASEAVVPPLVVELTRDATPFTYEQASP
jgi:hypothetical protein